MTIINIKSKIVDYKVLTSDSSDKDIPDLAKAGPELELSLIHI